MKSQDFNPIGCYVVAESKVWEVTGFFDCSMLECVEYFCQRSSEKNGAIERTSVFEDYEENLVLFRTWEQAEESLRSLKAGRFPSFIENMIPIFDDEMEVEPAY